MPRLPRHCALFKEFLSNLGWLKYQDWSGGAFCMFYTAFRPSIGWEICKNLDAGRISVRFILNGKQNYYGKHYKHDCKNPPIVEIRHEHRQTFCCNGYSKNADQGCERILIFTLSSYAAAVLLLRMDTFFGIKRWQSASIRTVKQYHDHRAILAALAQNVRDYWIYMAA